MIFDELTPDEQLALAALSEVSVVSNRMVTDSEVAELDRLAFELGYDKF